MPASIPFAKELSPRTQSESLLSELHQLELDERVEILNSDRNTGIASSLPKLGHFGPSLPAQFNPPSFDPYSSERSPQQPFIDRVHEARAPTPFHAGVTAKIHQLPVQQLIPSPPGSVHGLPIPHESSVDQPLKIQPFTQQF